MASPRRPRPSFRAVIFLCGGLFLYLALEYLFSANLAPQWLSRWHPVGTATRYYAAALPHLAERAFLVNLHVVLGVILLGLGFLQLSERFRTRHLRGHRILGAAYVGVGAATAALALALSAGVLGGLVTQLAMITIALLWYFSAAKAVYYALRRQTKVHQRWVVRNYFVATAPGLARPCMVALDLLAPGRPPEVLFSMSIWIGLLLSLLLSQWYVERSQAPRLKKPSGAAAAKPLEMAGTGAAS